MDMTKPLAKAVEQFVGQLHRRVYRPGVGDVETEARFRKLGEDRGKLLDRLAGGLARVHVLDHQSPAEPAVEAWVFDRVRVGDDRADLRWHPLQPGDHLVLVGLQVLYRGMDAQITKRQGADATEEIPQAHQLRLGEGCELGCEGRRLLDRLEEAPPVAAQARQVTGRRTYRVVLRKWAVDGRDHALRSH